MRPKTSKKIPKSIISNLHYLYTFYLESIACYKTLQTLRKYFSFVPVKWDLR